MQNDVTILTVIKDREEETTIQFLSSVAIQTYPSDTIVVDFGSSQENLEWERTLFAKQFDLLNIQFIVAETDLRPFRESRAINIGLRRVMTKYVILTNVDLILGETLVKEAMSLIKEDGNQVILCQRTDILEDETVQIHSKTAIGAFFLVRTDWLIKVRGIDENFFLWGAWDLDLLERAEKDHLKPVWVSDVAPVTLKHIWHPPAPMPDNNENETYRKIPNKPIIRNKEEWGVL